MTRTQIEYLLALAKTRSFGEAAAECFISQSTLSAMVAKFEEQVGFQIFSRKTRPIGITKKGGKIINALENIHREYLLLDERIREINEYEEGHIRMACIPTVAPYLFPMILNHISNNFPKIDFNIYELTTEAIASDIKSGKIDIGIISIPLNDGDLAEYDLYDECFYVYDYGSDRSEKAYRVTDIDLHRLWILEEGHCMSNQIGKICDLRKKKRITGNLSYNCGSMDSLIEMVHINNGITLLPELAINKNPKINKDYIHSFHETTFIRKIGLVVHKNFVRKRLLNQLIDIIQTVVPQSTTKNQSKSTYIEPF